MNKISTKITCDLCGAEFALNRNSLTEELVFLVKDGLQHPVTLTELTCPHCGKKYTVLVDDKETEELVSEAKLLLYKKFRYQDKGKQIPKKLEQKYQAATKKLNFKRQQLAEKFDGALYQVEGNMYQLDYRYHAR